MTHRYYAYAGASKTISFMDPVKDVVTSYFKAKFSFPSAKTYNKDTSPLIWPLAARTGSGFPSFCDRK